MIIENLVVHCWLSGVNHLLTLQTLQHCLTVNHHHNCLYVQMNLWWKKNIRILLIANSPHTGMLLDRQYEEIAAQIRISRFRLRAKDCMPELAIVSSIWKGENRRGTRKQLEIMGRVVFVSVALLSTCKNYEKKADFVSFSALLISKIRKKRRPWNLRWW